MSAPRPDAPLRSVSATTGVRLWVFRALALVAVPALLVVGLEIGLRVAGYGRPTGFLIPDREPGMFRTNPDYVRLFMPESFDLRPLNFRVAREKPANTLRVVVLGESAAQGVPAPMFGFAPQLRAQLRALYPGRRIEVLNAGVVAINSHAVYQIARGFAAFSPDLFVVYLGNNEVVGPYGPGCAYLSSSPPLWVIRASVAVKSTRTGQLLGALFAKVATRSKAVEWGGMSMFVNQAVAGDDPRLETVYRNFEQNLRDIVRVANDAGAPVLLTTVVANLKDCPPLLSLHRADLAGDELARWQREFDAGRVAWKLGDTASGRAHLEAARQIDAHHAETLFLLGSLELQAGRESEARKFFVEALHWDALRFRPDPRVNDIVRAVAAEGGKVRLVDTARLLGADPESTAPIAGRELLFEHVHFDWEGNSRVARAMAEGAVALLPTPENKVFLDANAAAAALGYTARERFNVLQRLAPIVQSPPFPNQVTYPEDMARLGRELAMAQVASRSPAALQTAKRVIVAAVASDPESADLAKLEQEIADDLGDLPGALAASQRVQKLQPYSYALAADEAIKLARLGRYDEAEKLLRATAARCTPREQVALAPAFGDLFARTKRPEDYRRHLDALLALVPNDANARLFRARELRGRDNAGAERELRAILERDPGQQAAQEELVALLLETGKREAAEQATLATVDHQSRNQANNLRAALFAEARGDAEAQVRFLRAAERSGPVNSGLELRLARRLFDLKRPLEGLEHLADARRLAVIEGDAETIASIDELLKQLRGA
ncbi:MAG: hypothetical protein HZA32_09515 [Opitutae bacterium]|nr:hypothetical protein [Opitutae bacterium]